MSGCAGPHRVKGYESRHFGGGRTGTQRPIFRQKGSSEIAASTCLHDQRSFRLSVRRTGIPALAANAFDYKKGGFGRRFELGYVHPSHSAASTTWTMNSKACAGYLLTSNPRILFAHSINAAVTSMSSIRAGSWPNRLVKNLRTPSIASLPVSDWIEVQTSGSLLNVLVAPRTRMAHPSCKHERVVEYVVL